VLTVQDAVALLDFVWEDRQIVMRLVDMCVIRGELERNPILLSAADIQDALDTFRAKRGLLTARSTVHWMKERGLTQERLENLAADQERVRRLRKSVTTNQIEHYFDGHRDEFSRVAVLLVPVDARSAVAITGPAEIEAAARVAVGRSLRDRRAASPTFTTVTNSHPWRDLVVGVFGTPVGAVCGPYQRDGEAWYALVMDRVAPSLEPGTRDSIEKILFDEWLANRRRKARIEWFWGRSDVTERVTASIRREVKPPPR
jgi:putative peptide maturation system protein